MVDLEQLAAEQLRLIEDAIVEIRRFGAYGAVAIEGAIRRELDKYRTFLRERTEWSEEHLEPVVSAMLEWTINLIEAKLQDETADREFKRELAKGLQLLSKGKPPNDQS